MPAVTVLSHVVHNDAERHVVTRLEEAELLVLNDPGHARGIVHDALDHATRLDLPELRAHALCLLAGCSFFLGEYELALDDFHAGRDLARHVGSRAIEARCVNGLGLAFQKLGDYGNAMTNFLESLRLVQEIGDEAGRVRALSNIASVHAELGEYRQALELHMEAISGARAVGYVIYECSTAVNAVVDYYRLGQYEESLRLGEETLAKVRTHGLRQYEGVLLTYRALTLHDLDRFDAALRVCQDALPVMECIGDREYASYLLTVQGRVLAKLGREEDALHSLTRALALARDIGAKVREAEAHRWLSHVLECRGNLQSALEHSRVYHELERTIHAEDVARKTRVLSAQVKVELLKREAEMERLRNEELATANEALKQAHERLEHQALHDALTGLANRVNFELAVRETLAGEHLAQRVHAVLFVDLDRFKQVNDTLGHATGDELLKQVAARLLSSVRGSDLVARMGGDEFTLLLRDLKDARDAERVARKLLTSLAAPFHVGRHQLFVTASVGVAVAPRDGTDVITLQKHADIAMYRAKHAGRNGIQCYVPDMGEGGLERLELERELREALRARQFVLHYQPQFDVTSGQLVGFEALVRWQHPTRGLVPPGTFIPLAEDSGLIVPLGTWVLQEAARQASAWTRTRPGLSMSVNVSALQFAQKNFLQDVTRILHASRLPPEALVLELTESLVMSDVDRAVEVMNHLRQAGVRVAMDDFGTGYSSLGLLQRLPIDVLKIDRSFVQSALGADGSKSRAGVLLEAIVTVARGLDLSVVAEGVETTEQLDMLRGLECHVAQGFLLSKPLPWRDIEQKYLGSDSAEH